MMQPITTSSYQVTTIMGQPNRTVVKPRQLKDFVTRWDTNTSTAGCSPKKRRVTQVECGFDSQGFAVGVIRMGCQTEFGSGSGVFVMMGYWAGCSWKQSIWVRTEKNASQERRGVEPGLHETIAHLPLKPAQVER
ncbi:unnamed protein product [Trifolium pratense]|uniref:Uncharacterized protein n=1 Tax=Trifolium pratense TaxID=57577 RepID=A0ACB0KA01_TRIPR|nr:unnamed protein product [Trifolium pratense]